MTDTSPISYYLSRQRREHALAEAATNPAISAIHLEMARRYSELASAPPLKVVKSGYNKSVG